MYQIVISLPFPLFWIQFHRPRRLCKLYRRIRIRSKSAGRWTTTEAVLCRDFFFTGAKKVATGRNASWIGTSRQHNSTLVATFIVGRYKSISIDSQESIIDQQFNASNIISESKPGKSDIIAFRLIGGGGWEGGVGEECEYWFQRRS